MILTAIILASQIETVGPPQKDFILPPTNVCRTDSDCKHPLFNKCSSRKVCDVVKGDPCVGVKRIARSLGARGWIPELMKRVSYRESRCKRETKHLMAADEKASVIAYRRMRKKGYYKDNAHFSEKRRWRTFGPFGQNSNLFIFEVDPKAPPEMLHDTEFALKAYFSKMHTAYRKLTSGRIKCKGRKFTGSYCRKGKCRPTYFDLHTVVSGGRYCPRKKSNKKRRYMQKHMGDFMWKPVPKSFIPKF